jgi:hypothetical protein
MRRRTGKSFSRRLWNGFTWLFLLFGFVVLIWAGIQDARDTYSFSRYGVEKSAHVVTLDHTNRSRHSTTFYYVIEIEGRRSTHGFPVRLAVGSDVTLLTLPDNPDKVRLGNENSSAFEIFTGSIGTKAMAVLIMGLYAFMAVAIPITLVFWIKYRKQILDSM